MKILILPFLFLALFLISCQQDDGELLEKNTAAVDVYVAGIENNKACYWKNNQQTYLSVGDDITPSDIFIENNNMYIVGYTNFTNDQKYFWKNNIRYDISQYLNLPAGLYSRIGSFTVKNNDIYFGGIVENSSPATPNDRYEYCYWKNGVKTVLFTAAEYYSDYASINSICIYNSQVYITGRKIINNISYSGYYEGTTFHPVVTIDDQHFDSVGNLSSNANNLYISARKNGMVFYKNILTGIDTQMNIPNLITPLELDGNDVYLMQYQGYYKNGSFVSATVDPEFELCYDMFILDQNIYSVRSVDFKNRGGKIYINNVETQYLPPAPSTTKQILKAVFAVQN